MQAMGFGFLFMLIGGAGSGELLDYIDTATYWQQQGVAEVSVETIAAQLNDEPPGPDELDEKQVAKLIDQLGSADFEAREAASAKLAAMGPPVVPHLEKAVKSDDAEVALRAEALLKRIQGTDMQGDPTRIRRLMAIRTLGELDDKTAIETLKPLLESTTPFEAHYALVALARINGTTVERAAPTREQLDADVAMLPAKVGIVAQQVGFSTEPVSLDKAIESITLPDGIDAAQIKRQVSSTVAKAGAVMGNLRLDAVTIGFAAEGNDAFGAIVARGEYDVEAVNNALKANSRNATKIDDRVIYEPEVDAAMIALDKHRFMVVIGERDDENVSILSRIAKADKGDIADNAALSKMIADVDKTGQLWAVAQLDENYKITPILQPFDTATLTGKSTDSGNTVLTLTAAGRDADQIATSVEMINGYIAQGLEQMKQLAATPMGPMVKPYQTMLESVEVKQAGTTMTITAEAPGDAARMMLMPWFGMAARAARAREVPLQAPAPAPMDTGF